MGTTTMTTTMIWPLQVLRFRNRCASDDGNDNDDDDDDDMTATRNCFFQHKNLMGRNGAVVHKAAMTMIWSLQVLRF